MEYQYIWLSTCVLSINNGFLPQPPAAFCMAIKCDNFRVNFDLKCFHMSLFAVHEFAAKILILGCFWIVLTCASSLLPFYWPSLLIMCCSVCVTHIANYSHCVQCTVDSFRVNFIHSIPVSSVCVCVCVCVSPLTVCTFLFMAIITCTSFLSFPRGFCHCSVVRRIFCRIYIYRLRSVLG